MTNPDRRIRLKICGITNLNDARCAAEAGADYLGFILYPGSPRYVALEQVATIAQSIRSELGTGAPAMVGVFVNESADRIQNALDAAQLDLAQLHGDEPPALVRKLYPRAFKAIRPRTAGEAEAVLTAYRDTFLDEGSLPQLLLDAYHPHHFGGTGLQADFAAARSVAKDCRLLLAGGLVPEMVREAIETVQPWGVDVSSGVEKAKGIKDHGRLQAFVQAVRGVR